MVKAAHLCRHSWVSIPCDEDIPLTDLQTVRRMSVSSQDSAGSEELYSEGSDEILMAEAFARLRAA